MASESQLREWRKFREQSRRALRPGAVLGGMVTAGLGVAYLLGARFPLWVTLAALTAAWFQFIGDWMNVARLNRRIAAAEREETTKDT